MRPWRRRPHLAHLTHAAVELGDDRARVGLVEVDHRVLVRLEGLAGLGIGLEDHLRLRHAQLVALAPHRLDQHGQVELAAAGDAEHAGVRGVLDAQRDVALQLALEALGQVARGDVLAFLARERPVVDAEVHRDRRRVDLEQRQDRRVLDRGDRLADVEVRHAGERDDVAGEGLGELEPLEALEAEHLLDAELFLAAVAVREQHAIADLGAAGAHAADRHVAEVVVVVERRDLHAQRRVGIAGGRRHLLDDEVEDRAEILALVAELADREALAARGVDHREVELLVGRTERVEQREHLVHHLVRVDARTIDLVDDDDRLEAHLERLLRHEPRLRHRALVGVDEEQHRVDHAEHALDLAAEVGVARGVDDVDARALPCHGGALRQDRDAALALEIVRVHRALGDDLAGPERAGLLEESIDEGGLAVIDVGDDCDVADT